MKIFVEGQCMHMPNFLTRAKQVRMLKAFVNHCLDSCAMFDVPPTLVAEMMIVALGNLSEFMKMQHSEGLDVLPPSIPDRPLKNEILCGPGPCNLWPSVFEAMSRPVLWPNGDIYHDVLADIKTGLQYVFQTKTNLVLAMSGSGHSGMETVISNLVGPGETLVIAARGIWDERAEIMAKRYGIKTVVQRVPIEATFTVSSLEPILRRTRPAALFVTHGDSCTGTLQNLIGLGDLCHKYGALLLVDTVVSLVAEPFFMDKWGVDGVYTSIQKAFSGPAGITPVAFSALAEKKIKQRTHEPPFYFDIKLLAAQWDCYGRTRSYHHTMSPPLMWALHCCLQEITRETLPVSWARHAAATERFQAKMRLLPVTFMVPRPEDRLCTVTTIMLPKGYDYPEFIKYVREKHNIVIFGGLGPTAGKTLRIGIMGVNATANVADALANAVSDAMCALSKAKL